MEQLGPALLAFLQAHWSQIVVAVASYYGGRQVEARKQAIKKAEDQLDESRGTRPDSDRL